MNFKEIIKALVPAPLWDVARDRQNSIYDFFRNRGKSTGTMVYCGFDLSYGSGMSIVARTRKEGVFEQQLCSDIVKFLSKQENPTFLDIGGNIGLISLYVLANSPNSKVYVFEPGRLQFDLFSRTVQTNSLGDRVALYNVALGEESGEREFFIHDKREAAKDGFRDTGRGGTARVTAVHVDTLDAWWKDIGRPVINVIKIDTEGAELLILRGGSECIAATRPRIYLEIEARNLDVYPYTPGDILSWLHSNEYELFSLGGGLIKDTSSLEQYLTDGVDTYIGSPKK